MPKACRRDESYRNRWSEWKKKLLKRVEEEAADGERKVGAPWRPCGAGLLLGLQLYRGLGAIHVSLEVFNRGPEIKLVVSEATGGP